MNVLTASAQDVYNFKYKSSKKAKVFRFWMQILAKMPRRLYWEVCGKQTNLVEKNPSAYVFKTRDPSKELAEYLSQFVIEVK